MKKLIFKLESLIFVLCLLVVSCQKDASIPSFQNGKSKKSYKASTHEQVNDARVAFAKVLAVAMQDDDLRKYIHARMLKRFTSTYELVYLAEKDKIIHDGKKLSEILTSYADEAFLAKYGRDFFTKVTDIDPLLAISMPELESFTPATWNVNYIPDVAAILELDNKGSFKHIFFDRNGEKIMISRNGEPTDPTITVWDAETTYLVDSNGDMPNGANLDDFMPLSPPPVPGEECNPIIESALLSLDRFFISGDVYYLGEHDYFLLLYNQCMARASGNNGPPLCSEQCDRDCPTETQDEELIDFKINGWGVFENIRNQWGETRYVFHADFSGAVRNSFGTVSALNTQGLKFVSPTQSKGSLLDCGSPCTGRFINTKNGSTNHFRINTDWDKAFFADEYSILWAEVDPASTEVSFSIPLTASFKVAGVGVSAGVTTTIKRVGTAIVPLGSQPVKYCDPILRENNTGSITFRVN
jgi:hypothetical protein